MDGRRIEVARGKVVGGSSSINAMAYVRGNRADYDRWASRGLPGWSYANGVALFPPAGKLGRRRPAPIAAATVRWPPASRAIRIHWSTPTSRVRRNAGYALNDDYNGAEQDGFARMQMTIRDGRRESAATGYLHPALSRENLTVRVNSLVTQICFDGTRAVGVDYIDKGESCFVPAEREVILSGGAINSPQLLMLSGIGDPAELSPYNIKVRAELPGVGRNLQDHVAALLIYGRRDESPFLRHMRADRLLLALGQGLIAGRGFATELPGGITGFVKTTPDEPVPDIQLLFIAGSLAAKPYLPPFTQPFADSFACRIVLLRPESRGSITLASANPMAHPKIRQALLSVDADWRKLSAGIRIFRELAQLPRLAPYVAREIGPGALVTTAEGARNLRAEHRGDRTPSLRHLPHGASWRYGAVVDPEMRVHGIDGLRVVDASVFPDLVGGNINSPVIMIAEKAADLILGTPVH